MKKNVALGLALIMCLVTAIISVPLNVRAAVDKTSFEWTSGGDLKDGLFLDVSETRSLDLFWNITIPDGKTVDKIDLKPDIKANDPNISIENVTMENYLNGVLSFDIVASKAGIKSTITVSGKGKIQYKDSTFDNFDFPSLSFPITVYDFYNNSGYSVKATYSGSNTVTVGNTINVAATVTFKDENGNPFNVSDGTFDDVWVVTDWDDDGDEVAYSDFSAFYAPSVGEQIVNWYAQRATEH